MSLGGQGVISVLSNVAPVETQAMAQAALAGDFDTAAALQAELLPLIELLFCEVNPIPCLLCTSKVKSEDFTARYEMAPLDELVDAYEAQWNGAAKTLVSPEWSCVIEDRDEEDMYIKVIRKEDLRML